MRGYMVNNHLYNTTKNDMCQHIFCENMFFIMYIKKKLIGYNKKIKK
jgi:hypothetical protein